MENSRYHIATSVLNFQACRYIGLAGYVVYMYDFLLTYSEVQRLIWPSPTGIVKACYYFNRVLVPIWLTINTWQMSGLTGPLSSTFCKVWIASAGYTEVISLGVSNMILLLRVYALYGRSNKVLFGLLACFIPSYITILVTTTLSIIATKDHIQYSPFVKACIVDIKPPILASIWAGPIVFEVLIFCMTLYKGIEHAKKVKSIANSPMLYTLYRDGLGYFVVIIIIKLFNLLVWCLGDKSLILLGIYFIWGVTTALVSRLLLNLRGVENSAGWGQETSISPQSAFKTQGSTVMLTGWFERTRNGTETIVTTTDDTKGSDDYWEEGMGLAAGTNNLYLGSKEREALQRREQEMKERRDMEKEKWREQYRALQIVPKYGSGYPPVDFPERILVIGQVNTFSGDEETIAEPTSAHSEKFATMPYDPTLDDSYSYPDLSKPNLKKQSRHSQRTPQLEANQEVEMIQRGSFLPSSSAFRTNSDSTSFGPNIERLLLRIRSAGGSVWRSPSSEPGSMRTENLPNYPAPSNLRTPQFPPRNPPG